MKRPNITPGPLTATIDQVLGTDGLVADFYNAHSAGEVVAANAKASAAIPDLFEALEKLHGRFGPLVDTITEKAMLAAGYTKEDSE